MVEPSSVDFPPALPHGEFQEVFPNIFFVQGTNKVSSKDVPFTMYLSKNMTVLRGRSRDGGADGGGNNELILVNTLRFQLGTVKHVIRLGAFHGKDDQYYKTRYPNCTVWSVDAPYIKGFDYQNHTESDVYFTPDKFLRAEGLVDKELISIMPSGVVAKMILIESSTPKEGILSIQIPRSVASTSTSNDKGQDDIGDHDDHETILITGDSLQNWDKKDTFTGYVTSLFMWIVGFIKPCNVGPGWYESSKPDKDEIKSKLYTNVDYDHVLPTHGKPVIGNAKAKYQAAIHRL